MKIRSILVVILAAVLIFAMSVNFTGCTALTMITVDAADLMEGIEADPQIEVRPVSGDDAEAVTDFAVRLLKNANEDGKNVLISPVSVLAALSMTANGAKEETLDQMEKTLGMDINRLNGFFKAYTRSLYRDDKNRVRMADSIWFRNGPVKVLRDFLQINADYYGAGAYKSNFDDETLKDINNWVKKNTDGMIHEILDRIPDNAFMYLINALAFDAEWEKYYESDHVSEGEFTLEDGTVRTATLMTSTEDVFIETDNAPGFAKKYANGKYAFVALLPNEGVTVSKLIDSLDGKTVSAALSGIKIESVSVVIPKFETEYDTELSAVLKTMGMTDAFDPDRANFTGMASFDAKNNLYIGRVLHKTYICVAEKGTKAGAASAVEILYKGAAQKRAVILDRPFVYMIVDTENLIPLFIGSLMDTGA